MTTAERHAGSRLHRSREIAQVLVRHGLGHLVAVLGLEHLVPFHQRLLHHGVDAAPPSAAERVRMALGELGATFIKLGQILSTRADLLPPAYQTELAKLQDQAPPVPVAAIRAVIEAELGRTVEEAFASFDPEPLAAASIGQVHAATLHDGTAVIVKVRRPGVVEQVEEDLAILHDLAAVAARRSRLAERYDLPGLVREFGQTLHAELDYLHEAGNAERFAEQFAGDAEVHIPRVCWETTTARVLTLERMQGLRIDDTAMLDAAGIDRQELAERATRVILTMVFEHGFFHADPHPGNFFIEPGGRIGLIDFGMTGTLDESLREQLVTLLFAITSRDMDLLVDVFLDLGVARGYVDRGRLRQDLDGLLTRYYDRPLGEIVLGPLLLDAQVIVRRHHLRLPANLALLLKTVIMCEGLGQRLDPGFNLTTVLVPFTRRLTLELYSPARLVRRLAAAGVEATRLGLDLPKQVRHLIGELEQGRLTVSTRLQGVEPVLDRVERLANRLVLGIIAAAFVNGLAILMSVYDPLSGDRWLGAFFAVGFMIAAVLGAYLAWSILRPGRR